MTTTPRITALIRVMLQRTYSRLLLLLLIISVVTVIIVRVTGRVFISRRTEESPLHGEGIWS